MESLPFRKNYHPFCKIQIFIFIRYKKGKVSEI